MVLRTIDRFHEDSDGEWVAELSCLHNQHVRHRPPFSERAWATTPAGRAAAIGSPLECPLCDRAELPEGLDVVRTAGPFDSETLPAGLRRNHRVAERTWGVLRVLEGAVRFTMATDPCMDRDLETGDSQVIPPGVPHAVQPKGSVRLAVEFLARRAG